MLHVWNAHNGELKWDVKVDPLNTEILSGLPNGDVLVITKGSIQRLRQGQVAWKVPGSSAVVDSKGMYLVNTKQVLPVETNSGKVSSALDLDLEEDARGLVLLASSEGPVLAYLSGNKVVMRGVKGTKTSSVSLDKEAVSLTVEKGSLVVSYKDLSRAAVVDGVLVPLTTTSAVSKGLVASASSSRVSLTGGFQAVPVDAPVSHVNLQSAPISKESNEVAVRLVLVNADYSIQMVQIQGQQIKTLWTREEALSAIVEVVAVDLEDPKREGAKLNTLVLLHRLVVDIQQVLTGFMHSVLSLQQAFTNLSQGKGFVTDSETSALSVDKCLVVLTRPGKMFGLSSVDGRVLWSSQLDHTHGHALKMYLVEETLVVVVDTRTGVATFLDALTGAVEKTTPKLSSPVVQALASSSSLTLVQRSSDSVLSLSPIHGSPPSNLTVAVSFGPNTLQGYEVINSQVVPKWTLSFGDAILDLAGIDKAVKVSSPAKPLGDQSLLIHHLNSHLVAVASQDHQVPGVSFSLVDVVSGKIVHRAHHASASAPVSMLRFENWFVYSYWNAKMLRTELSTVTLYEAAIEKYGLNPYAGTTEKATLSVYDQNEQPLILQRTFVFPLGIKTLAVTQTKLGITNRQILVGLNTGQVLGLSPRMVDPRRTTDEPTTVEKMEGLMQYFPDLPVIATHFLTHEGVVLGLDSLRSFPTKLESSSVVVAFGVDLFVTVSMPSKGFDLLSEDFNKLLLGVMVLTLFGLILYLGRVVAEKQLKAAWK